MPDENTRTAAVVVDADTQTAFRVFTEEMTDWWMSGPTNFYDATRALGVRCESGVGGRLIEVYDDHTGEGLELGRIEVWEPGALLRWQSSVDDVEITVRFEPADGGTRVEVEARVPEGGRDEGGSAWVRVAPAWFARWCGVRSQDRGGADLSPLGLTVYYDAPGPAARWLNQVVGLEPTLPLPDDDAANGAWIEFRVGTGLLVVLKRDGDGTPGSPAHVPWVFVDDLDSHHAAAKSFGGKIVEGIHHHGYRAYTLEDPEGYRWTIAQALPAMSGAGLKTGSNLPATS